MPRHCVLNPEVGGYRNDVWLISGKSIQTWVGRALVE
jgi:hypothetical protein